jgi:hypothetical protein
MRDERVDLEAARGELAERRARFAEQTRVVEEDRKKLQKQGEQATTGSAQLEASRKSLDRRAAELEARQAAIEIQAGELERRLATLGERESDVAKREKEREQRVGERDRLQREVSRLNEELSALRDSVASQQVVEPAAVSANVPVPVAGPTIQLLDPSIPRERGIVVGASGTAAVVVIEMTTEVSDIVGRVEAPAGIYSLTVNSRAIETEKSGLFRATLDLADSQTDVVIVAVDRQGKRAERRLVLRRPRENDTPSEAPEVSEEPPPLDPGIDFGKYYALVIGNGDYTGLPDLATAGQDAVAVSAVLRDRYGFKVTFLRNATRYEILSALNNLRAELTARDNLLIYYAGHGDLDEVNMRGHWLPIDAEPDSSANWISNVAITDILNAMSARHVLVVADSCYSGTLTRSSLARLEAGMTPDARNAWLRAMSEKRSRTALTSGGLKPVLDGGGGGHSIFARVFIEVLEANAGVMEGQQVFQEVSARVTWASQGVRFEQVPEYAPIRYAGHEAGDFFFVSKGL